MKSFRKIVQGLRTGEWCSSQLWLSHVWKLLGALSFVRQLLRSCWDFGSEEHDPLCSVFLIENRQDRPQTFLLSQPRGVKYGDVINSSLLSQTQPCSTSVSLCFGVSRPLES